MIDRIACIVCGQTISSTIDDPRGGDRPRVLVCGAHSDEELSKRGLASLWAGLTTRRRGVVHDDPTAKLVGAWELGPDGAYAVYLLLERGGLLIIAPSYDGVELHRVARGKRLLECPIGVPAREGHPWRQLTARRATLARVSRDARGCLALAFPGHGTVTFSTEQYSWGELGAGSHFLAETWSPEP